MYHSYITLLHRFYWSLFVHLSGGYYFTAHMSCASSILLIHSPLNIMRRKYFTNIFLCKCTRSSVCIQMGGRSTFFRGLPVLRMLLFYSQCSNVCETWVPYFLALLKAGVPSGFIHSSVSPFPLYMLYMDSLCLLPVQRGSFAGLLFSVYSACIFHWITLPSCRSLLCHHWWQSPCWQNLFASAWRTYSRLCELHAYRASCGTLAICALWSGHPAAHESPSYYNFDICTHFLCASPDFLLTLSLTHRLCSLVFASPAL